MTRRWAGPEGSERWHHDAAALLASEHLERRDPDPSDSVTVTPGGTLVRAALQPGERMVAGFSCGFLCSVDEPPGYGFRLVGLLAHGVARVLELPGYTQEEAFVVARTWANYPEVIDEAAGPIRPDGAPSAPGSGGR